MTTYYVATTGSNGNGTSSSPWRTISEAMAANLKPGDEVVVRPGTYNEAINISKDGSAAGNITLRSEVPGGALIRPPAGSLERASRVNADYVVVDGFDIGGGNGDGIEANDVHHVQILNNKVHDSGESGIQFNRSDFITIEGNETYNNASSGWFSGISIYQNRNITGDTSTTGFRTIVRNNISHDNVTKTGAHTDGNGIIIDDFQSTQTSGHPNYTYQDAGREQPRLRERRQRHPGHLERLRHGAQQHRLPQQPGPAEQRHLARRAQQRAVEQQHLGQQHRRRGPNAEQEQHCDR